jgi:hypothetical protein
VLFLVKIMIFIGCCWRLGSRVWRLCA